MSNKEDEKISGTVARVSAPMKDRDDSCIMFCLDGDKRGFSAYLNGNYSAPRMAFLLKEGDQVEFTLHPNTRAVREMTIKGLND